MCKLINTYSFAADNTGLMKKIVAVISFSLLFAACSSTRGKLLSRVEYHDDTVFEREVYHYSGDELALVTRITLMNNAPDSTWTEYEIKHNGQTTDTIETTNSIHRIVKSSDGSIRSYDLVGGEWKEKSYRKRDEKGRIVEVRSGGYHDWYTFDAQGRPSNDWYETVNDNNQIQKGGNIIEYSDDGLQSVTTTYYQLDSLPAVISGKSVYRYDRKGRILSRESFDPDETDSIYPNYLTDTYKYIGNKVIRIESLKQYKDGNYHKEPSWKYKEKYKNGLRTKSVTYIMKDGKFRKHSVHLWKYDFRSRVPIKEFGYSPDDYVIIRRPWLTTIWTYE